MLRRLFFPETPSSAAMRYGLAAAACLLAFVFRLSIEPLLQEHSPLVMFTLAVAVSAIRGGFGPGLFATAVGSAAALYFFPHSATLFLLAPEYLATGIIQVTVFLMAGFMLSWLGGELRSLRWQALETARQRNEIMESITDGFAVFDAKCRFVFLNRAAEQMIGKDRMGLIGRVVWDEVSEMRGTDVEQKLRQVLERHVAAHFEFFSNISKKWFEFHLHPNGNGGFTVYFRDISERKHSELRLQQTLAERDAALTHVRLLTGLLPVCAACKKIRDDKGNWQQMESYITNHSEAQFSHSMCPECAREYYGAAAAGFFK